MVTLIASCCFCHKVRDDLAGHGNAEESWVSLRTYRTKYQLDDRDLRLSHTYCPGCLQVHRDLLFSTTTDSHALPL